MDEKKLEDSLTTIENHLRAIAILRVEHIRQAETELKAEVLLSESGLAHKDIARIVCKSAAAVSKAISRAS